MYRVVLPTIIINYEEKVEFSFVYKSTILGFCAPVQTEIPNLPNSSIMWTKDLSLCTRELDY